LLLHEGLHRAVQVRAHEALQRVAVQADDLRQQLGREHRLPVLLVLGDDLQQHLPGQVLAALGVADLEVLAVDDQLADILDGDVAGNVRVVEAAVRIFLDDARLGHGAKALTRRLRSMAQCSTGCKEPARATPCGSCRRHPAMRVRGCGGGAAERRGGGAAGRRVGVGGRRVKTRPTGSACLPGPPLQARSPAPLPHQPMYWPPFADRFAPVIQLASSGMKKLTAYAISSGSPRRPVGIWATILARTSSGTAITMSVPM